MPKTDHAIAPGGITCQMSEDGKGGRRYVLQVRADAVPIAEAFVQDFMTGRYRAEVVATQDAVADGVAALNRLLDRVKENPHTGQSRRIVLFLAGLYNGTDYPFDLTELRAVDQDIAGDCLEVLILDSLNHQEVHLYIDNGTKLWPALIKDYGLKPIQRE